MVAKSESEVENPSSAERKLLVAVREKNLEQVKKLLAKGVDPNCMDEKSNTPIGLVVASRLMKADRLILNELVKKTRNADVPSGKNRMSPLGILVKLLAMKDKDEFVDRRMSVVKLLLEKGADPNFKAEKGSVSPFEQTVLADNVKLARLLVGYGGVLTSFETVKSSEMWALLREFRKPGDLKLINLGKGVEMAFCWCPATTDKSWIQLRKKDYFSMGSPDEEIGRENEREGLRLVKLTKGFWMAQTPVTRRQYMAIMEKLPSADEGEKGVDMPVVNVTWDECRLFCTKLTCKTDGADVAGLPTEAQWEYACRAGTTSALNNGKNFTSISELDENLGELGWFAGNSGGILHPVRQKKANDWKLYDMHGNVEELCADEWSRFKHSSTEKVYADPFNGKSPVGYPVAKGGCYSDKGKECRSAARGIAKSNERRSYLGFRPILVESFSDMSGNPSPVKNVPKADQAAEEAKRQARINKAPYSAVCKRWRLKMTVPPETPVPTDFSMAKKKIARLMTECSGKNDREKAKMLENFAKDNSLPAVRFLALCRAIELYEKADSPKEISRMVVDMVLKDGCEYALNVIKRERKKIESLSHKRKGFKILLSRIEDIEWAAETIGKLADSCIDGEADSATYDKMAQAYMILGQETNAYAELVCSDEKLSKIMKITNGEWYERKKTFGWLAPDPEMVIADFWWNYGKAHQNAVGQFCRQKSSEWCEKAIKGVKYTGSLFGNSPRWVKKAQARIFQTEKGMAATKGVNNSNRRFTKFKGKTDQVERVGNVLFPIVVGFEKKAVPDVEWIEIRRWNNLMSQVEKWYRPSSYWLNQTHPSFWMGKGNLKINFLIVPMEQLPLRDYDFDESISGCPTTNNLAAAFSNAKRVTDENMDEWVARYVECPRADVIFKALELQDAPNVEGKIVEMKGESRRGVILVCAGERFYVDFQPVGEEIVDDELVIWFAKAMRPVRCRSE